MLIVVTSGVQSIKKIYIYIYIQMYINIDKLKLLGLPGVFFCLLGFYRCLDYL